MLNRDAQNDRRAFGVAAHNQIDAGMVLMVARGVSNPKVSVQIRISALLNIQPEAVSMKVRPNKLRVIPESMGRHP